MATRRKDSKKASSKKTPTRKATGRDAPRARRADTPPARAPSTETIVQRVTLPGTPRAVWDAYLDAEQHARFTGAPAAIDRRVGGKFRAYDGYIDGVILELVAPRAGDGGEGRVVQSWRASDFPPEYPHSRVEIALAASGRGTSLTLTHSGVPPSMVADFARGWEDFYWGPLGQMLRGGAVKKK